MVPSRHDSGERGPGENTARQVHCSKINVGIHDMHRLVFRHVLRSLLSLLLRALL